MCPSCHSSDISRSRKRKLVDAFMRWMGKTPYRCRDCQKRFYVNSSLDRRLRQDQEWRRKSAEHVHAEQGRRSGEPESTTPDAEDLL
jgi:hypothetical protein